MIAPQAVGNTALVVGAVIAISGLAGALGLALQFSGVFDCLDAKVRAWGRRVTRDRSVDLGDGADFTRHADQMLDMVADDPLPAFCCALYGTGCRHEKALAAVFGEPDAEYARLLAADPSSFERWAADNGLKEIEA